MKLKKLRKCLKACVRSFVNSAPDHLIKLPLWSRGRVDGLQSEGPWFDPHAGPKTLYHIRDVM